MCVGTHYLVKLDTDDKFTCIVISHINNSNLKTIVGELQTLALSKLDLAFNRSMLFNIYEKILVIYHG